MRNAESGIDFGAMHRDPAGEFERFNDERPITRRLRELTDSEVRLDFVVPPATAPFCDVYTIEDAASCRKCGANLLAGESCEC